MGHDGEIENAGGGMDRLGWIDANAGLAIEKRTNCVIVTSRQRHGDVENVPA